MFKAKRAGVFHFLETEKCKHFKGVSLNLSAYCCARLSMCGVLVFFFMIGSAFAQTFTSTNVPRVIPDNSSTTSILSVPSSIVIGDINVTLSITHPYTLDLDVSLRSPGGTTIDLFSDVGAAYAQNFTNTTLDDEASTLINYGAAPFTGSYRPETQLSMFDGQNAQGTWTLILVDDKNIYEGTLTDWSITITPVGDTTAPTVLSKSPTASSTITLSSVDIDVTFSETVIGVDATDMVLSGTAATSASKGTPTNTSGNIWRFPISGLVSGSLNISLAPDANDIEDAAGNDLSPQPTTWSYTVSTGSSDTTPPSVSSKSPVAYSTITSSSVNIDVTFSETVYGVSWTDMVLSGTAATSAYVNNTSNTSGNTWRFPVAGLVSGTLNISLAPSVGNIYDAAGNDLSPRPTTWSYTVSIGSSDTTPPTVSSKSPVAYSTITSSSVNIDVTFSENVYGVAAADMVLSGTASSSAYVGTPTNTSGYTWRFPVYGLVNGTLSIYLAPDANDIEDAAGNDLSPSPTTWSYTVSISSSGNTYSSIDVPKTIPDPGSITSTLYVASTINITDVNLTLNITHSWVTDLSATLTSPTGTVITLFNHVGLDNTSNFSNTTFDDEASTSITAGSAPFSGSYRPATALSAMDGQNAQGTWTLTVSDNEAIISGTINSWSITITGSGDTTAPTVTGKSPAASSTITTSAVNIDVTFSEAVTGVNASDMVISGTAATLASVGTPVNTSGYTWRFPVSGLANGTLSISLAPDVNDIEDAAGNDLSPRPTTWSYTVAIPDTNAPTITSKSPVAGSTVAIPDINVDITFSETVTGVDASDMVLSGAAAAVAVVGTPTLISGTAWRFPITGLIAGPLSLALAPDVDDIQDAAGNDLSPRPATWSYTASNISQATYPSTNVPRSIPDPGTITSTLNIASPGTILDVNVTVNISHGWVNDLDVYLRSPLGTTVELFTDVGLDAADNFTNTTLDDEATTSITAGVAPFTGSFRPESLLSALDGQNQQGTWTLTVTDDASIIAGTLNAWSVTITTGVATPIADFLASTVHGEDPLEVEFLDLSSPGSDPITYWEWNFGDGETSNDSNPVHVFEHPGVYTVALTVTTDQGSDTKTKYGYIVVVDNVPALDPIGLALLSAVCGLGGLITLRRKR